MMMDVLEIVVVVVHQKGKKNFLFSFRKEYIELIIFR